MTKIKNMDLENRDVTKQKRKDGQKSTVNNNNRLIKHIPPPKPEKIELLLEAKQDTLDAEDWILDVARIAAALITAGKPVEGSRVLEPVKTLIRKAHEYLTQPVNGLGGLSPCGVLYNLRNRMEDELERIAAMLSACYAQPLASPVRNVNATVIVPAVGAAEQKLALSPGDKTTCPHVSQDVFPRHCDTLGRCGLDFLPEYRYYDIYLEGDFAMKNSLPALCLACILLTLPACQHAEPTNLDRFAAKCEKYLAGEMNDGEMLALVDQALAGDAKGDPFYTLVAYMTRGSIFFKQGNHKEGVESLRQGLNECANSLVENILAKPDEPINYELFEFQALLFDRKYISSENMLKLCDRVLTKDALGNGEYMERAYAVRSLVFLLTDSKQAEEDARKAIAATTTPGRGYTALADALLVQGRLLEAADALELTLDNPKFIDFRNEILDRIKGFRERATPVTPREFDSLFVADEAAAARKYKSLDFTLRGEIKAMDFHTYNKFITIMFEGSQSGREVICYFPRAVKTQLEELHPGQTVTVFGVCAGIVGGQLSMSRCVLMPDKPSP